MKSINWKLGILFVAALFFAGAKSVNAISFPATYDVTYTLQTDGQTSVSEQIVITNDSVNQYPSQYTLSLEGIAAENIQASDSLGEMRVETEIVEGSTHVTVHFNVIAAGQGATLPWSFSYDTKDIAKRKGKIWEIQIPQVILDERVSSYNVTIQVPNELGVLDYADPQPQNYERTEATRTFTYNFSRPNDTVRAVLAFGSFQLVDAELTYHLQNPLNQRAQTEIALPPSIPFYQKTFISSLIPEPDDMRTDEDGNIFAIYTLRPQSTLDIHFSGQIFIRQRTLDEVFQITAEQQFTPYTATDKYWDLSHETVRAVVQELGNEQNLSAKDFARTIYSYVTQTLRYDTTRVTNDPTRYGAVKALQNPQNAICTDYTDLTVTLMRALGIPAREVNGYAFTQNKELQPTVSDVLHAWVQIYLPEYGWVPIDPTWGSTSNLNYFDRFDTNHVTFVIKGRSSEYPYPAGSYKIAESESNDVSVTYAETFRENLLPVNLWIQQWQENNKSVDLLDYLFQWIIRFYGNGKNTA